MQNIHLTIIYFIQDLKPLIPLGFLPMFFINFVTMIFLDSSGIQWTTFIIIISAIHIGNPPKIPEILSKLLTGVHQELL